MPRKRICLCCERRGSLNEHDLCPECAVCLHCEKQPSVDPLGLCEQCVAAPGVQEVYTRRRGWTTEWELHLRRKTAEVQAALRRESRFRHRFRRPPATGTSG